MTTKTITQTFDDLTGEEGATPVKFSFDGLHWTIDLTEKNKDKFEKALAPYLEKASPDRDSARAARSSSKATKASDGPSAADVRAWAEANKITYNGKPVKTTDKGRVPAEVVEKYNAAP